MQRLRSIIAVAVLAFLPSLAWAQAGGQVVQIRGGSATNIAAITPASREILFDTTNLRLVLGNGSTLGGAAILPNLAAIQAAFQPLLPNLTAFGALSLVADRLPYANGTGTLSLATFTSTARSLLDDTSTSAMRTTLGLAVGVDVQAASTVLDGLANASVGLQNTILYNSADSTPAWGTPTNIRTALGLVIGTNVQAQSTNLTTYAGIAPASNVQSLLGAANYSAMRTLLTLVPGTDVQAFDTDLATFAGLSVTRGALLYGTSAPAWAVKAVGTGVLVADGMDVSGWTQAPTLASITGTGGQSIFASTSNTTEIYNGTSANAQILNAYYIRVDPSNYSRAALKTSSTGIELAAEALGTGWTNADLLFTVKGTGKAIFRQPGGVAGTDEVQLSHDGSKGIMQSRDGTLRIRTVDGTEIATSSDVVQIKLGAWAQLGSGGLVSWSSASTPGSDDTGIARVSAAALKITDASSGYATLRALGHGVGKAPSTAAFIAIDAGTTAKSQLNLASSTAPTSPVDGDIWFDGTHIYCRISGATKQLDN